MDKRIVALSDWGCDVKSAMRRMLNDEEFYIDCLNDIPADKNFALLLNALKCHNVSEAFGYAHTLKGALINLGLTPMYNKTVEIVEPLRIGNDSGMIEKAEELINMKIYLEKILNNDL